MDMSEVLSFHKGALYDLPGDPSADVYLLPVSGGADSSALAILMHALFPNQRFEMVFTDTLADDPSIYETLNMLERYLGKEITRVAPDRGLFELIDHYNGYLPSPQARWCTRELKLVTFSKWIKQYEGRQKWMFVGIRADESGRLAFTIDEVETVMPFIDMGMRREDIFSVLDRTIGIPKLYRVRSRSGCTVCPFQRRSEIVGMLQEKPVEFVKGMKYEKLAPADASRHPTAIPLHVDSGISPNWLTLPMPAPGQITGRRPKKAMPSLFGEKGVFVGAEFFMDGWLSNHEFIWHQRVVSYSPTLAGISQQLDDRYRHLLSTGEVYGLSPDEVRSKVRFAIYYIELSDVVFDPEPPKEKGYTWQQGSSYRQVQHIVSYATRALHAEGMRQEAAKRARPCTVQEEWIEGSRSGLAKIQYEVGHVAVSQWYTASEEEPQVSEEEELALLPCPMCHL
jgi:3'-phosphoadenosine 5'-phosphosulfate sulfotransferase (PAPS reductase)/FAD synthetase